MLMVNSFLDYSPGVNSTELFNSPVNIFWFIQHCYSKNTGLMNVYMHMYYH